MIEWTDCSRSPESADLGFVGAQHWEAVDAEPHHSSSACQSRSLAGRIANPSEAPEEALRGVGIAPSLNEDVEHNAILIDGAPDALDSDEDFVHVPLVAWARPAAAQAFGETRTEFLAPASHRLV